jgi:hypothetical protein
MTCQLPLNFKGLRLNLMAVRQWVEAKAPAAVAVRVYMLISRYSDSQRIVASAIVAGEA